jgi:hypothetical protein
VRISLLKDEKKLFLVQKKINTSVPGIFFLGGCLKPNKKEKDAHAKKQQSPKKSLTADLKSKARAIIKAVGQLRFWRKRNK